MDFSQVNKRMEAKRVDLITRAPIDPELIKEQIKASYMPKLNQLIEISKAIIVHDESTEKQSIEMEVEAKKLIKAIEDKRKEAIEKPYAFVQDMNKFCKVFKDKLDVIIRDQKSIRKDYQWQKELERRKKEKLMQEAQAKAQKELEEKAKKADVDISDIQPAPPPIIPKEQKVRTESGATSYLRDNWVFKIIDISKVDRAFLVVDEKLIKAQIALGKRGNDLAGIEIYNDPISMTRR